MTHPLRTDLPARSHRALYRRAPGLALAAALLALGLGPAQAQGTAAAKPAAKPLSKASEASARSAQRAAQLATFTVEQLNASQLDVADRVLTGVADCEFNQKVAIDPVQGHPGHFHVRFKQATYTMVPQETSTGAVRLEDRRAGMVWLQIPAKSMLMNAKAGQRVADSCTLAEQRAAVTAVQQAIGIANPAPTAAPTPPANAAANAAAPAGVAPATAASAPAPAASR